MTTARGAPLMDGVAFADEIITELRARLSARAGRPPCLATVIATDERSALANLRRKHVRAREAGLESRDVRIASDASQRDAEATIRNLACDASVDGIFMQLPLPQAWHAGPILDAIPSEKDVDGATASSLGRLVRGETGFVPCTPRAIVRLLERYGVRVAGTHAVIVGRAPGIVFPLAVMLSRAGAGVTLADAHAPALESLCRHADIVVSAAGIPNTIARPHVKPGAAVVDAGGSRTEAGLVGDVDLEGVRAVAGAVAPMPGGIGPATIACLLENTVAAARVERRPPNDDRLTGLTAKR